MASYTNQFPTNPQHGDTVSFSTGSAEKSYYLAQDTLFFVSLAAGGGGNGAYLYANTGGLLAKGGDGGYGGIATFYILLAAGTYKMTVGNGGVSANSESVYGSAVQGASGGGGASTRLNTASGSPIAEATGGDGGTGGYASDRSGATKRDGTKGANGSAAAYASRGCYGITKGATNQYSGHIRMTVIDPNELPTAPGSITYGKPNAGKTITITLTPATDPEGTEITYTYERQVDNGAWVQVATSPYLTITDTVPTSGTRLRYRAKATDAQGGEGDYITGEYKDIDYNNVPTITGEDGALGTYAKDAPSWPYSVDDADEADAVTVTEYLDGDYLRSYAAVKGQEYTLTIPADAWLRTLNGAHTLTISASDGKDEAVRTLTFTRDNARILAATAHPTTALPKACTLTLVPHPATWPDDAVIGVRLCNDAYADAPHWETPPLSMLNGPWYTFDNQDAAEGEYGLGVELTIEEGASRRAVAFDGMIMGVS